MAISINPKTPSMKAGSYIVWMWVTVSQSSTKKLYAYNRSHDEPVVQGGLNPSTGKHHGFEGELEGAILGGWVSACSATCGGDEYSVISPSAVKERAGEFTTNGNVSE